MCTQKQAMEILDEVYNRYSAVLQNRVTEGVLYGSYARGDHTPESDVDILLVADVAPTDLAGYRPAFAAITSELSLRHDVTVSVTVKPLEQFRRYAGTLPYYRNVTAEGIHYVKR